MKEFILKIFPIVLYTITKGGMNVLELIMDNCLCSSFQVMFGIGWFMRRNMHMSTFVFPLEMRRRVPLRSSANESKGLGG